MRRVEVNVGAALADASAVLERLICSLLFDERRLEPMFELLADTCDAQQVELGSALDALQAGNLALLQKRARFEKATKQVLRQSADLRCFVRKEVRALEKQTDRLQKQAVRVIEDGLPNTAELVLPTLQARCRFWQQALCWLDQMDGALNALVTSTRDYFLRLEARSEVLAYATAAAALPIDDWSQLRPAIGYVVDTRSDFVDLLELPLASLGLAQGRSPWSAKEDHAIEPSEDVNLRDSVEDSLDKHRLEAGLQPYLIRPAAELRGRAI